MIVFSLALACFVSCWIERPVVGAAGQPDQLHPNLVRSFYAIELVAFSPDGTLLATGGRYSTGADFMVCQVTNLEPVWPELSGYREGRFPTAAAFHSRFVAFGTLSGDAGAGTLDQQYGITLSADSSDPRRGTMVAFSPLPDTFPTVVHAGESGIQKTRLYGLGERTAFPGSYQGTRVTALAVQPDGATFLLGNAAGTVQRWQVEPPQLLWQTNFPNHRVSAINALSSGQQIVTLFSNQARIENRDVWRVVRLWEVGQTNWLQTIHPEPPVLSSTLTPDGHCLFAVLQVPEVGTPDFLTNQITLWRVSDGRLIVRYDQHLPEVTQVAVSPDGKTFAYGDVFGVVTIARMPLLLDPPTRQGSQMQLHWNNLNGPYQVQQRTNLAAGDWENLNGPTTNTSLTVPLTNSGAFIRVHSLTNAP
jgi:WD40 repeat protein